MTIKNSRLYILPIAFLIVLILFASGSPILTKSIFGIPAGNLILWIGFIALQLMVFSFNNGFNRSKSSLGQFIRYTMITLIVLSILWFGIAYVLSGDTGFNFSSSANSFVGIVAASKLHWVIIYVLIISPIVLMLIYRLLRFFEIRKERSQ